MIKMKESGLKFGRTWVDRIMGKVDKDQGVANAGKVLGIGNDGQVVPVEQSGGTSLPFTATAEFSDLPNLTMVEASLNIGTGGYISAYDSATNTVTVRQNRETRNKFTLLPTTKTTQNFEYSPTTEYFTSQSSIDGKATKLVGSITVNIRIDADGRKIRENSHLKIDSCTVDGNPANVNVIDTGSYFADITKCVNIYLN